MGKLIQFSTGASHYDGEWHWQAAGMGYVIVTDNGHLICIDGGTDHNDAENFVKLLEETAGGKPTVDLWILTHPHDDHFSVLYNIAADEALKARVTVKKFLCTVPDELPWQSKGGTANAAEDMRRVFAIAPGLNAEFVRALKDDVFTVDGTKVTVYHTYLNADELEDPNELSMVFSVQGRKKKAMFTGDSYRSGLQTVLRAYDPSVLKSDIIQIAHHALNGGDRAFYEAVDADIALVPISRSGDRAMKSPEENCSADNDWAIANASTVLKAFTGTASVDF